MKQKIVSLVFFLIILNLPIFSKDLKKEEENILNKLKNNFVKISFFLKKSNDELQAADKMEMDDNNLENNMDFYVDLKKTLDVCGVIIDTAGTVITSDNLIDPKMIDKIICETYNNEKIEYYFYAVIKPVPLILLKPKKNTIFQICNFSADNISYDNISSIKTIVFEIDDNEIKIKLSGLSFFLYKSNADSTKSGIKFSTGIPDKDACIAIITDSEYIPIGITINSFLDISNNTPIWKLKDILSADMFTANDYELFSNSIKNKYLNSLYKTTCLFRKQERQNDFNSYSKTYFNDMEFNDQQTQSPDNDKFFFGFAVDKTKLFIPETLSKAFVKKIDDIEINCDSSTCRAALTGVFKDISGFVVTIDSPIFNSIFEQSNNNSIKPGELFFILQVSQKSSLKNARIVSCRFENFQKRYNNLFTPNFQAENGSIIIDGNGKAAGFYLKLIDENFERKKLEQTNYYYPYAADAYNYFYPSADLLNAINKPDIYFNKRIKTVSKSEEKIKVWFGVEFQPVNKDYARISKLEKITKDGNIGLIVSLVYPNSPAAQLGIKNGDILLKIREKNKGEWLELAVPDSLKYSEYPYIGQFDNPEFEQTGFGFNQPKPWLDQNNYLNILLETFSAETEMELLYYNGETLIQAKYKVQQAPPDFESAKKYKHKELGLTVKEITYEVQSALKLTDKQTGVIITEIEPGLPAAVARLSQYSVITTINDKPISTIDDFKSIIQKSQQDSKSNKIEIVIFKLGRSKIAHIIPKQNNSEK